MPTKERTVPTWGTSFRGGVSTLWRTGGRAVWERLGDSLMDPLERSIVAADPDLADSTLKKMVEIRGGKERLAVCNFHFDNPAPDDTTDRANDIGYPALSYCIKQDRNATWAEVVARYSLLRRIPFLETALALRDLWRREGSFVYFDSITHVPVRWSPRMASLPRVDIDKEWAALEQLQGPTK